MMDSTSKKRRFQSHELILSEVIENDLLSIAEGYYSSFPDSWFSRIEPPEIRKEDRAWRFAERMKPWLHERGTRWTKVTISPTSEEYNAAQPNRVIGHAGWLLPERTKGEVVNFWRRDASDVLGWREKMGWSKEYEEELWGGTDVAAYQASFLPWDKTREHHLAGIPHWHLAPIWVLPEFQGRSIASVLLNDAIAIADKDGKREPMYLEAMPAARAIYARFGWKSVVGDGEKNVMIRNAPENVPVQGEEEWKRRGSSQ